MSGCKTSADTCVITRFSLYSRLPIWLRLLRGASCWTIENNIIPDPWLSGLQGVDKNITRERVAMILCCYSRHMGYDLSLSTALTGYSDYGQMRATGLITSDSSNKLAPRITVTCSEANTILTKFLSTVAKSR